MHLHSYISLLRGINVSGQKLIKMEALAALYTRIGFEDVVTYIQSGNVIFRSSETSLVQVKHRIEQGIQDMFGFNVVVIVFTPDFLLQTIENDPFSTGDIAFRYVTFLSESDNNGIGLDSHLRGNDQGSLGDQFVVAQDVVYLYCPNGYGKTKLTNTFFEKKLKQPCSTRNWKTVLALSSLIS